MYDKAIRQGHLIQKGPDDQMFTRENLLSNSYPTKGQAWCVYSWQGWAKSRPIILLTGWIGKKD